MKKMLRRNLVMVLVLIITAMLIPTTVGAARVGDVIGYAQPTDIVAMINGYQIESYNVNGHTYICVEDLKHYGFDVYFDGYSRTLSFNRNYGVSYITPHVSNAYFWSIGSNNKKRSILYTDIATYANNSWVQASNINGLTIVNFNTLAAFGAVSYDNNRREISLVMEGMNYNELAIVAPMVEEYETDSEWNVRVRAKGNMLTIKNTSKTVSTLAQASNEYSFSQRVKSGDLHDYYKDWLDTLASEGYDISSIYVEFYTGSGQLVVATQIY